MNKDEKVDLMMENNTEKILVRMYELAEINFKQKETPIVAILVNEKNEIMYENKNEKKIIKEEEGKVGNYFHAEHLLFKNLIKDLQGKNIKYKNIDNWTLFITCVPCSECIKEVIDNGFNFKIKYLTSLGKKDQLEEYKNKYEENCGTEWNELKGNLERMRLIACKRWIDWKYNRNIKDLKDSRFDKTYKEINLLKKEKKNIENELNKLKKVFKEMNKLLKKYIYW